MKKILTSAAAVAIALSSFAQEAADTAKSEPQGFIFTDIITIPSTSVKNQSKSGTCWSFAGTGFVEDYVRKVKGDSLDLSEMFTVHMCYLDKARRHVRLQGSGNVGEGGSIVDVPYVMGRYGAIPEEVYNGLNYGETKHDHSELSRAIEAYMNAVTRSKKISTAWEQGLQGILDAYLGKVPETFEYQGKTYTPKSYAESLGINFDDFIAFTSFTHHPYWKPFAVEVRDNWLWAPYNNVPLDTMKEIIDHALENGYTVNWAADVSNEKGWNWKKGYAVYPARKTEADLEGTDLSRWVALSDADKEKEAYSFTGPDDLVEETVTPEERQRMFDSYETTDDHGMVIVGTAQDQNGNKYYKVKNSWGTDYIYGGYFYVSEAYLLAKTMSFMVHKDALPKDVKKKFNI